ncbi:MAG: hypothetical protein KatS3mg026_0542 [Bacteroidia bacterium]|nr:MAG: hypothetical protein KatS3mg026_0542 [Bacteroidia bacterium]
MRRGLALTGLACALVGGGLVLLNELLPLSYFVQAFQTWQSHAWMEALRRYSALLYEYREKPAAWRAHPEVLFLEYSREGRLLRWNTARWPLPAATPSFASTAPEILSDEQSFYYALKLLVDSTLQVVLLPIRIEPVEVGVYPRWDVPIKGDWSWIHSLQITRQSSPFPIVFRQLSGEPVFRLYLHEPERLRRPGRWVYSGLLAVAFGLALVELWRFLRRRYAEQVVRTVFLGLFVLVWQGFHWSDLPAWLWESRLSSARECAFSPLHTSLWDIAWSLGILLWATTLLPKARRLSDVGYDLAFWGVWGAIGGALYLFAQHSQLNLDPADIGDWLMWIGWGGLLAVLWRVLGFLWRSLASKRLGVLLAGAGLATLILLGIRAHTGTVAMLLLLFFSPLLSKPFWGVQVLRALLVVGAIDGWIDWAQAHRARRFLEAAAPGALRLRDAMLEYRLAQTLPRLASDSALWSELSPQDDLIDIQFVSKIHRKYFLKLGENYDIHISCWTAEELRLDNLFEWRPPPWRQVVAQAEKTFSPYLFFVVKGTPRYYYVARVPVYGVPGGLIWVRLELYPRRRPLREQLYPLETEQAAMAYALYEKGYLVRQWGLLSFPPYLSEQPGALPLWREQGGFYEYLVADRQGFVAFLRYPLRSEAARLATIPILLGLLALGLVVQDWKRFGAGLRSLYARRGPLVGQLRGLFWVSVALPLIGLVGISFALFWRFSENSLEASLRQRLSSVGTYLAGDPTLQEKLAYWIDNYMPSEESFVRDLMRRVAFLSGTEVFLYNRKGYLYSSTLPPAYWGIYIRPFLEPELLERMQPPSAEVYIETTAEGSQLRGYIPLRAPQGHLLGVLHIPLPLSKRSFYEPLQYFLGYVVNVYLVLAGGAILVGLLLIQRFAERLEKVVGQLRAAPEAPTPPLLTWESRDDEIDTLAAAYNDMVERLRASQKQLEATLRRVSQQEIASQAAHEIKTALTPLKLQLQHLQRLPEVDPPKLREITTRLLDRVEALVRIANSFMTFARLDSPEGVPQVPVELVRFVSEHLQPFLHTPSVPVELRLPEVPLWIQASPDALQQVLNNLMQNALQALEGHPAPRVWVTLTEQNREAILAIQDNGPGIPLEVRERIFEFYFTTRRTGTGLGLAITKGLVERMGGRISFSSEVGMGTTFYVVFPVSPA